ncbi:unnamed protein product [Calypogeia fissa]
MTSNRPSSMMCRLPKISYLLFIHWVLLQLPRPTHAAISESFSDYHKLNSLVQEAFPLQNSNGRQLLQDTSSPAPILYPFLGPAPAPILYPVLTPAPTPYFYAPGPAPMPVLFPSDPPVTVPYAPAPGILTIPPGNCSVDLTALEPTIFTTATDCSSPLAVYVGVAMCCPQIDSLLRIIQGQHIAATGSLGLNRTDAEYCYSEIANIISAKGTNSSLLCSVESANLTVGSCPVTTVQEFEKVVNTTSLLQACENVDFLKECPLKTCQNEIGNATLILAGGKVDAVDDCHSAVLSWVASHSAAAHANSNLRLLSSCTVNQECPLVFNDTSPVAMACNSSTVNGTCCDELSQYMQNNLQTQMLVTNEQAYRCAENFGLDLQSQNVTTDIYSLCKIRLSDFSLQAHLTEGCLLSSLPTDINITSGILYFICDLSDNIQAHWPGSNSDFIPSSPFSPSPSPSVPLPSLGTSSYHVYGLSTIAVTLTALAMTLRIS